MGCLIGTIGEAQTGDRTKDIESDLQEPKGKECTKVIFQDEGQKDLEMCREI